MENILTHEVSSDIIAFLEGVDWKDARGSFFSFQEIAHSADIETLREFLARTKVESLIRVELEDALHLDLYTPVRFGTQKYTPGSGVGPHTDSEVRAARFILNLNRGWSPSDGGIWLLSNNDQLLPEPEFIAPANNSGFAFVPAKDTYHALSERSSAESYALILEFPLR